MNLHKYLRSKDRLPRVFEHFRVPVYVAEISMWIGYAAGRNSEEFIQIWWTSSDWPCQQGEAAILSACLAYLCTLFLPRHGSSCEPEAAGRQNLRGEISRCPLCTRFAGALLRSPAFFCVFSPFSSGSTRAKYRGVARVCPADGSEVTCCY